ncbi:hypothetical protein BV20DRAFT_1114307 [Pilatotrama ljubarskyi]|nr:hypothetical protein BV20DRAFT_1114307 [Pilatotrama ljubarskyi]
MVAKRRQAAGRASQTDATQTAVPASARSRIQSPPILKLPVELVRLIFAFLSDEPPPWLASISTICKALLPEVDAILYRFVYLNTCKAVSRFISAVLKRTHRPTAVRTLLIEVFGAATFTASWTQRAIPSLTNLRALALILREPVLFDHLLCAPVRLEALTVGGKNYPVCFPDILASQPNLRKLSLSFEIANSADPSKRPCAAPQLRTLAISAHTFPPQCCVHRVRGGRQTEAAL